MPDVAQRTSTLAECIGLARMFFRLGSISFGGPAAMFALIERETVTVRRWLTEQEFVDLLGAAYLVPGPIAIELASLVGYRRAGIRGMFVAGLAFLTPAVLISGFLAWLYLRYGDLPVAGPMLAGIKPIVVAVFLPTLFRMAKAAIKGVVTVLIALGVFASVCLGANEIVTLLIASLVGTTLLAATDRAANRTALSAAPWPILAWLAATPTIGLASLGWYFLKTGLFWYGGGYVLLAYMQGEVVEQFGWITQQQLMDAAAVGQVTPGPFLSMVTFIGYLLHGWSGALVATAALVAPSFFFAGALGRWLPTLRGKASTGRFLTSVNAAALGLTAAVGLSFGRAALVGWQAWAIAGVAMLALVRFRLSPGWAVLGGVFAGLILYR